MYLHHKILNLIRDTRQLVTSAFLSKGQHQCDKIGPFLTFLVTNYLSKVAQMFCDFLGVF